ncbi:MAG: [citrate (pro-3S)-lyase] ligase [Clostridia bacterium]|nr:[citrate (pro-3S)-lyase] ligase [Clostridia bacterium]
MYNNYNIEEISLEYVNNRDRVKQFLTACGLAMEQLDCYLGIFDGDKLIGGGGVYKNTIKCVAILDEYQNEQLTNSLITQLRQIVFMQGYTNVFLFTKPKYNNLFAWLSFYPVGRSQDAVLLESKHNGIREYVEQLRQYRCVSLSGAIVMNCNPMTNGHLYLIEQARKRVDRLHIFIVAEEQKPFTFMQRFTLVQENCRQMDNVVVHKGTQYIISSATFPAYFIKDSSAVALNQMQLDLNIFATHIAPALNISLRFVGSEPLDNATNNYNQMMKSYLPEYGINVEVIERITTGGEVISASRVRKLFNEGALDRIAPLVPSNTMRFLTELHSGVTNNG